MTCPGGQAWLDSIQLQERHSESTKARLTVAETCAGTGMVKLGQMNRLFMLMLIIWLVGCRSLSGAITPEGAIREQLQLSTPNAQNIEVLGVRQTPNKRWLIIFTFFSPPDNISPGMFNLGYGTYERTAAGLWQPAGSGGAPGARRLCLRST